MMWFQRPDVTDKNHSTIFTSFDIQTYIYEDRNESDRNRMCIIKRVGEYMLFLIFDQMIDTTQYMDLCVIHTVYVCGYDQNKHRNL